ncbi:hypothetical protein JHK85_055930 [Glycine max]|nr:hypothetical protein JHK86_054958 [Glycine max]KAG4917649.1 hypothetical protein JHK85_055930 [Glycine max]
MKDLGDSKEYRNPSEQRTLALEQALGVAETKAEANVILEGLGGKGEEGDKVGEGEAAARVPVVRLRIGEVAETSSMVLLPISAKEEKKILEACRRRIEDRLGKFSLIQLSEEHPNGMRRVVKSLQEHQSGVHESRERVGKDAEKPIKVSLRCLAYLNKP